MKRSSQNSSEPPNKTWVTLMINQLFAKFKKSLQHIVLKYKNALQMHYKKYREELKKEDLRFSIKEKYKESRFGTKYNTVSPSNEKRSARCLNNNVRLILNWLKNGFIFRSETNWSWLCIILSCFMIKFLYFIYLTPVSEWMFIQYTAVY